MTRSLTAYTEDETILLPGVRLTELALGDVCYALRGYGSLLAVKRGAQWLGWIDTGALGYETALEWLACGGNDAKRWRSIGERSPWYLKRKDTAYDPSAFHGRIRIIGRPINPWSARDGYPMKDAIYVNRTERLAFKYKIGGAS